VLTTQKKRQLKIQKERQIQMKDKDNENNKAMAATASVGTGLVKQDEVSIVENDNTAIDLVLPAEFLADLNAEIESGLKALSIDNLTASRDLIGKDLTVTDAFLMTFQFNDPQERFDGQRVCFEVADEAGIIHYVAKSPQGSNLTYANIFTAARKAGRRMELPRCEFVQLEKGGRAGNRPVILKTTRDTRPRFY
jgi:hypothetical protein